jgi:hypothetical protein
MGYRHHVYLGERQVAVLDHRHGLVLTRSIITWSLDLTMTELLNTDALQKWPLIVEMYKDLRRSNMSALAHNQCLLFMGKTKGNREFS